MKFNFTTALSASLGFLVDVVVLGVWALIAITAILANIAPRAYISFAALFQDSVIVTLLLLVFLSVLFGFVLRKILKITPGSWLCRHESRPKIGKTIGHAVGAVLVVLLVLGLSEFFIVQPEIYRSDESHFIAEFAHEPQVHKTSFYNGDLNVDVHMYSVRSNLTNEQSVTLRRYSKPIPLDKFQSMAKLLIQDMAAAANLKVNSELFSENELFPRLMVDAEQVDTGLSVHILMAFDGDKSVYILSDVSLPNGDTHKKFFESFRIVK